mgnify:CR=1 FL=1
MRRLAHSRLAMLSSKSIDEVLDETSSSGGDGSGSPSSARGRRGSSSAASRLAWPCVVGCGIFCAHALSFAMHVMDSHDLSDNCVMSALGPVPVLICRAFVT